MGDEKRDRHYSTKGKCACTACTVPHEKDIVFIENRKDCISTSKHGVLGLKGWHVGEVWLVDYADALRQSEAKK
jgi:hypothetical protein